jgi:hypothetical protein
VLLTEQMASRWQFLWVQAPPWPLTYSLEPRLGLRTLEHWLVSLSRALVTTICWPWQLLASLLAWCKARF